MCQGPSQVAQRAAAVLQQASAGAQEGARPVPGLSAIQTTEALRNFPLFVLNLEAPPDLYDVTYEVSKTTIAFRDEDVRTHKLVTSCHFSISDVWLTTAIVALRPMFVAAGTTQAIVAALDHALEQFLQLYGVLHDTEVARATPLSRATADQTSCIRQHQRRRVEVAERPEIQQRRARQHHDATMGKSGAAQPVADNKSVSTASQLLHRSLSVRTHKTAPAKVELDMVPDHIMESIGDVGEVGLGFQATAVNDACSQASATCSSIEREPGTYSPSSCDGGGGSISFVAKDSRHPGPQADTHPLAAALPREAHTQGQPCSAALYSIPDLFDSWQNPVLSRHGLRHQAQPHLSSCDVLPVSPTDTGTVRQLGGGEHVRIASLDDGAPAATKRRRRESSAQSQRRDGAVDAKQVAADVKLKRSSLQNLRVCGQFDCRVILCTLDVPDTDPQSKMSTVDVPVPPKRLLVAVDQHAADERVQLERLTESVYGEAGDERNFDVIACEAMWGFDTHEHPQLLEHAEVLRSWGFTYTFPRGLQYQTALVVQGQEQSSAGANCCGPTTTETDAGLVQMHTVPRVAGVTLAQVHLRKFLSQLSTDAMVSRGSDQFSQCGSFIRFKPTAVSDILAYRACHSAVRFGDQLTHHECCRIISQLAQCRLPFQCAHGRPTLHPMMVL